MEYILGSVAVIAFLWAYCRVQAEADYWRDRCTDAPMIVQKFAERFPHWWSL